jgi:hypothetical protein
MAAGAIGGLALGLFVALFLMPCFYVLTSRPAAGPVINDKKELR